MGVVALILAILGFILVVAALVTLPFGLILVIIGIVLGILAVTRKRQKVLSIIALILSVLAIISAPLSCILHGASYLGKEIEKAEKKQEKKTEKRTEEKTPIIKTQSWPDKSANYKQTYETKDLKITINNVRKATGKEEGLTPPPGEKPGYNYVWLVVNLSIKNVSDEPKEDVTMYVPQEIVDSQGNKFHWNGDLLSREQREKMGEPFLPEEAGKFTPAVGEKLPPGEEVAGNIWFSVWEKSTGLKLMYEPGLFGRKLEWNLQQ